MAAWVTWVIVAVLLALGEAVTARFLLAPFAAGSVLAALVAAAGAGTGVVWATFAVVAALFLLVVRPIARSKRRTSVSGSAEPTVLVGRPALVLERIANGEGMGCVRIGGEVWTARARDASETIEAGTHVEVVDIRGATALVS